MIYFDVTKTRSSGHQSGLMRVSARLRAALGDAALPVEWAEGGWRKTAGAERTELTATDWLLTAELFSEHERPGFKAWVQTRACRWATIFHDAIPLRLPQITWPQSVARHPGYMKLLAQCNRVWAVSQASREELAGYWRWLGLEKVPAVEVLALGADFDGGPRRPARAARGSELLCVGILEPRKNQEFLFEVAERLWREGLKFELHLVGRVNPHFGRPIERRLRALQREFAGLHFHQGADDATLAGLFARVRATVFPTKAEGCGLPLIESLWRGVPCVASDLPVLRENAAGGGCVLVPLNDPSAWMAALRRVLTDDAYHAELATKTATRDLPTWAGAGAALRAGLTQ
jgi:glycosyltransferase involved in cell wall biosynthesis